MDNKKLNLSQPPLNLLINPDEIRRKKPWEINLDQLLDIFIKILEQEEIPDLRICGSAILSSALIYRLKVESFFLFEKLQVKRHYINRLELSSIINLPYRYELSTTSLEDIVSILESVLKEISQKPQKKIRTNTIKTEPVLEFDEFSTQIQSALREIKIKLLKILSNNEEISFRNYVNDMKVIDRLRTFILILFAANDGVIKLIQEQDDIKIVNGTIDVI